MTATIRIDASKILVFENVMSISTNAEDIILTVFYRPCDSNDPTEKHFLCGQWQNVEVEP